MEIGGDDDPEAGAGVDVDVGIDAALGDEPEGRELLEEFGTDLGAFADEDEGFGVAEADGQGVRLLEVVVPDHDLVNGQLLEAGQGAEGVEVVVEDGDLHERAPVRWVVVRRAGEGSTGGTTSGESGSARNSVGR